MKSKTLLFTPHSGRTISYAEFGDPEGKPLIVLHGTPGSHIFWGELPGAPYMPGVRLIAPDRPGYGHTVLDRRDTLRQYAYDVAELAASLGITTYSVLGLSGGAPHALAMAAWTPEQIDHCGVITPLGPYHADTRADMHPLLRLAIRTAQLFPALIRLEQWIVALFVHLYPAPLFWLLRLTLPYADLVVCSQKMKNVFLTDLPEAYRQWGRGQTYDATLPTHYTVPLQDITHPITMWVSDDDRVVGHMGQYMADLLPVAELYTIPKEGHFWSLEHMPVIIHQLFEKSPYSS